MAVLVAEDLDLDVARPRDVALEEHAGRRQSSPRLAPGGLERRREVSAASTTRMPRPPPPALALISTRVADRARRAPRSVSSIGRRRGSRAAAGTPCCSASALARALSPSARMAAGGGPTQTSPASMTRLGEVGVFGQKAVAGVDRRGARVAVAAARMRRLVQVAVGGRRRPDAVRLVGLGDVQRVRIGIRVHRDRANARAGGTCARCARAISPRLATRTRTDVRSHAEHAERRRGISALSAADRPSPSTMRVSTGSITPSSHSGRSR